MQADYFSEIFNSDDWSINENVLHMLDSPAIKNKDVMQF